MAKAVLDENRTIVGIFFSQEKADDFANLKDNYSIYERDVSNNLEPGGYISDSGSVLDEKPEPDNIVLEEQKQSIASIAFTVEDGFRGEDWAKLFSDDVTGDVTEEYKTRTKNTADWARAWIGLGWRRIEIFEAQSDSDTFSETETITLDNVMSVIGIVRNQIDVGLLNFFYNHNPKSWSDAHEAFELRKVSDTTWGSGELFATASDTAEWEGWRTTCYKRAFEHYLEHHLNA